MAVLLPVLLFQLYLLVYARHPQCRHEQAMIEDLSSFPPMCFQEEETMFRRFAVPHFHFYYIAYHILQCNHANLVTAPNTPSGLLFVHVLLPCLMMRI